MAGPETRSNVRMPKYLGAKIEFNNRNSLVDCIVRNQSSGGALLKIETAQDIPPLFDLHIAKTDETHACALVWTAPDALGVRFLEGPRNARRKHLRVVK